MSINKTAISLAAALRAIALPSCKKPNHPPDAPSMPTGPSAGRTGLSYSFASWATDPEGDSVSIRFAWGDGDTSEWQAYVQSGDTVTATHAWSATGTYAVRAQASDTRGTVSEWSLAFAVIVNTSFNTPPCPPSRPEGPDAGYVGIRYTFSAAANDPEGDSVSIRFLWGADTGQWSSWVASGEVASDSHEWQVSGPIPVRAQARDYFGAMSDWSPACTLFISSEGTIIWKREDIEPWSSACPAIAAEGTVYVTSQHGLFAFDPEGNVRWSYPACIFTGPSVAADGTIHFLQGYGHPDTLVALNAGGTIRWQLRVGEVYSTPALAEDGTIYICTMDGDLIAIGPEGSERWHLHLDWGIWSSAAVGSDGTVYVVSEDSLHAVRPDGTRKWSRQGGGEEYHGLAIADDGTIYHVTYPDSGSCLIAVNPDGSEKWRYPMEWAYAAPVIGSDGTVYVGTYDGDYLYAISSAGALRWCYSTQARVSSTPALAADGRIYLAVDGEFRALNTDGGVVWRLSAETRFLYGTVAIGLDGTIYAVSRDEGIWALRGTAPLATSQWPKFQHDLRNTGRVGAR